jgi:hypothetical protein
MGLIHVPLDRFQWRTLVNTTMNLGVSQKSACFLSKRGTVGFSMKTAPWDNFVKRIIYKYPDEVTGFLKFYEY